MIELNLLPPSEKELLNMEQTKRWIAFYGGSIFLTLLGFIAALGFIWFFILLQLKSYSQSLDNIATSFQGQSVDHQKQLIADFNGYLKKMDRLQTTHRNYSLALAELTRLIPPGARVEGLAIDEKGRVSLAGFAPQREQVLLLQEALTKSSFFTDVEKPLANLTKQTNINFNFYFNIKTQALTND